MVYCIWRDVGPLFYEDVGHEGDGAFGIFGRTVIKYRPEGLVDYGMLQ